MTNQEAVIAFSQSEKIKAGLIWITQALESLAGLPPINKKGAERMARIMISLMLRDVHLSKKITPQKEWVSVEKHIDMALVMLDSGVAQESGYHLTRALSRVTDIGQRSMTILKDNKLL